MSKSLFIVVICEARLESLADQLARLKTGRIGSPARLILRVCHAYNRFGTPRRALASRASGHAGFVRRRIPSFVPKIKRNKLRGFMHYFGRTRVLVLVRALSKAPLPPCQRGATSFGATNVPACGRRMLWGIRSHFGRFRRYLLKSGEENKILNCGAQNYKFLFLHRLAVSFETSALGLAENVQGCNGWRSAGCLSPALNLRSPVRMARSGCRIYHGLISRGLSERRGCQLVPI